MGLEACPCGHCLNCQSRPLLQVFELVKNSLRAVYDRFDDSDAEPPQIRLVVAEGEEDITIKVGWAFFLYLLLMLSALPGAPSLSCARGRG